MKSSITKKTALHISIDALKYLEENTDFVVPHDEWTFDDVRSKLDEMIASIEKAASAPRKPKKDTAENENIKREIIRELERSVEPLTASTISDIIGHSTNKITALLRQLVQIGLVMAMETKGRSAKSYKIAG